MPKNFNQVIFISMAILFRLGSCKRNIKKALGEDPLARIRLKTVTVACFICQIKQMTRFGLQTNLLEDTLLPGETRVFRYGRVKVTIDAKTCERKRTSWSTGQMTSSCGEWTYNLDHCQKKSRFEYGSTSAIQLVDVTDY